MGIPLWTLRLMQGTTILKEGKLESTEEHFLAVQVKCPEVATRSQELAKAFKRPFRRQMNGLGLYRSNLETIESHLSAISNGPSYFFTVEAFLRGGGFHLQGREPLGVVHRELPQVERRGLRASFHSVFQLGFPSRPNCSWPRAPR